MTSFGVWFPAFAGTLTGSRLASRFARLGRDEDLRHSLLRGGIMRLPDCLKIPLNPPLQKGDFKGQFPCIHSPSFRNPPGADTGIQLSKRTSWQNLFNPNHVNLKSEILNLQSQIWGGFFRLAPFYPLPAISESAYCPPAAGNPDFLQTIKKVEDQ